MTKKLAIGMGVVAVAAFAVGLGLGRTTDRDGDMDARGNQALADRTAFEALRTRNAASETELARLNAATETMARESAQLRAQVKRLEEALLALRESREESPRPEGLDPPVAFGRLADLEAVRNTDWVALGTEFAEWHLAMSEELRRRSAGLPPDPELENDLRKIGQSLMAPIALLKGGLDGEVSTHAVQNGEVSHPLILTNLVAGALESAGLPLADEQKAAIAEVGNGFEREYEELQLGYTGDTLRLEKILDELELKSETMRVIEENILTSEQRQAAFGHAVRHRLCDDWFSPVVMTSSSARPTSGGDPSSTISLVKQRLAERYGLGVHDVESTGSDWLEALTPLLRPTGKDRGVTLEETITAGRAQEVFLHKLLATAGDDIALRRRILEEVSWFVPRVVEE